MAAISFTVPALQFKDKTGALLIQVQSSLKLRAAGNSELPQCYEDLLHRVQNESLWIRRSGLCYLKVNVSVQEDDMSGEYLHQLAEEIRGFEASDSRLSEQNIVNEHTNNSDYRYRIFLASLF